MKRKVRRPRKWISKALAVIGAISFMLLLGLVGSCELDRISLLQFVLWGTPCMAVFSLSIYLHNKLFGGYCNE